MNPRRDRSPTRDDGADARRRRQVLTLGAGLDLTLLAGCAGDTTPDAGPTAADGTGGATGRFRLLISDQPVAIDEFDELTVAFDRARIFRAGEADEADEDATATTPTATETPDATATTADGADEDETEGADEVGDDDGGFFTVDLAGESVDLTQVVGDRATGVFDGELAEGRYSKIELYATDVEGIVDGEAVEVMIPSGKLQIVKPFEVVAGETVSFVFDINVVKRGRSGRYNLLPVIAKSGVAGEDVEVEVVDDEADDEIAGNETGNASADGPAGPDEA